MDRSRILCLGLAPALQRTLTFPHLQIGQVNRASDVRETASGKATNTARVLRALGAAPVLLSPLGGETGRRVEAALRAEGLPARLVPTASPTRICQTLLDASGQEATELVEELAPLSADDQERLTLALEEELAEAKALILCGRLPAGWPASTYAAWIAAARGQGVPVFIDAQDEPMRLAVEAGPRGFKLNRHELGHILGQDLEALGLPEAEAVRDLLHGPEAMALVTDGPDAALLVTRDGAWRLRPPAVRAVNPIGSGDSVTAGWALRVLAGDPPVTAAAFGLACGTANALSAEPGCLDPATVQELVGQVSAERLDPGGGSGAP